MTEAQRKADEQFGVQQTECGFIGYGDGAYWFVVHGKGYVSVEGEA